MPLFDTQDLTSKVLAGNHYGYSGMRIDRLGASEYTLVGIAAVLSDNPRVILLALLPLFILGGLILANVRKPDV